MAHLVNFTKESYCEIYISHVPIDDTYFFYHNFFESMIKTYISNLTNDDNEVIYSLSLWEYFQTKKVWLSVLITLVCVTFLFLIVLVPYTCSRRCCRNLKKDQTRSDYRKYQKVIPGLIFIVLGLLASATTSVLVMQTTKVESATKHDICHTYESVDIVDSGGDSFIGIQPLAMQIYSVANQFQVAQDNYQKGYNSQWMQGNLTSIQKQITQLQQYTNYTVPGFDSKQVQIQVFSAKQWNQTLSLFNTSIMETVGYRLQAGQHLLTMNLTSPKPLNHAAQQMSLINQAVQLATLQLAIRLKGLQMFVQPYFITLYTLYSVTLISILIGIIAVFLVLTTERRLYKNYSHISYLNGSFALMISIINVTVFSFFILLICDYCAIFKRIDFTQSTNDTFLPEQIQGVFQQCLFDQQDLTELLDIKQEMIIKRDILKSSQSYFKYSQFPNTTSVMQDYINQLQQYIKRPSTMLVDGVQPSQQLKMANSYTNTGYCDGMFDQLVDMQDDCTQQYYNGSNPKVNLRKPSCFVSKEVTGSFFNSRYGVSANCTIAKQAVYSYLNYTNYLQTSRVLQKVSSDILLLQNTVSIAASQLSVVHSKLYKTSDALREEVGSFKCGVIREMFFELTADVCNATLGGWVENLVLICLQVPLLFGMAWMGSLYVIRNRIDISRPVPLLAKDSKPKKGEVAIEEAESNKEEARIDDTAGEDEVKIAEYQELLN